ncbi:MAG: sigma 54-interacting transcriptional regulator [Deltaproteobacteria bacterium]|nr:sigma 54-interacting transcriptional regulator [Deltaproteobacteria bacterium]
MEQELVIHSVGARRFSLGAESLLVGRGSECDVVLQDQAVSRTHCQLLPDGVGGWTVEDLGSRSGTVLDGSPVQGRQPLKNGSWLQLGDTAVQFADRRSGASSPDNTVILSGEPIRDVSLLRELLDALSGFAQAEDLEDLLCTLIDRGVRVASGERGALFLAEEGGELEVVLARDRRARNLPLDEMLTRTLPRRSVASNRPVVIPDTGADEVQEEMPLSVAEGRRRSVVCIPLPGEGGARGVLYVDSLEPANNFSTAQLAVLGILAVQASAALDRARESRRAIDRRKRVEQENATLRVRLGANAPIGDCPAMERTLEMLRRVAPSQATVCLSGETGTGKEVLARYLHRLSPRASGPFAVVDCGALPETLIESELFGHEKGAFTGAAAPRRGRLREAHGGTVFLDEVGEIPLGLQPRLLRFLQEQEVRPIGGAPISVDVRVICATHRDLEAMVAEGSFRQDLYYRLAVLTVPIPKLEDREQDVLLLARHFLQRLESGPERRIVGFTHEAREALLSHSWPGNVRELEHRIQRGALLAAASFITRSDLGLGSSAGAEETSLEKNLEILPLQEARSQAGLRFELAYLERVLTQAGGSVSRAAKIAGVSRQSIHALLGRHGIDRTAYTKE